MNRRRVVQWSTGSIGTIAVRVLAERPDLELAGVWVHGAEKAGRDAGELAGVGPLSLAATSDRAALLALRPDCICYTATGESRTKECLEDFHEFLAAGINIVTTSIPGLVYPPAYRPDAVRRLEEACRVGGATLYASGIEPGFAGDELVLALSTLSNKIESVRTQEIFSYAGYSVPFTIYDLFGFGRPPEHQCIMERPGVQQSAWGPPVRMVADQLGAKLDTIRETYEKGTTNRRVEIPAGVIEAGTVAAVRFATIGVVEGRDAIVIEHINRVADHVAPQWPTAERDGTYRLVVDGDPGYTCELTLGDPETFHDQGMIATTMRAVNAIPYVCDAAPGLVSSTDLPTLLPRHAFGMSRR